MADYAYIGKKMPRVDSRAKVTGQARLSPRGIFFPM